MGEWISNNILLPVMYTLIDVVLIAFVILLLIYIFEKSINNDLINKILRRK
tara:strand:+ start:70 stop:222 length:153 start_codon:yes stop_codon:yes gene_type:complete